MEKKAKQIPNSLHIIPRLRLNRGQGKLNTNIMQNPNRLPSNLQPEEEGYIWINYSGKEGEEYDPQSRVFLPCKVTAVKFTAGTVMYDVEIDIYIQAASKSKTRLHGVTAGLVITKEQYFELIAKK